MKIKFKKVARSLTGFSTPVFGVSWNPPADERETVRQFIVFLEDRRVLFNPYDIEMPEYVDRSIIEIRQHLTELLGTLDENSKACEHIRAMRAACRKFLDKTTKTHLTPRFFRGENMEFFSALGELRAIFGVHTA